MKHSTFEHEFVESMPSKLEQGKLYVSTRYRTAIHLCACGCGKKVVAPLRPGRWTLLFDGDSISLWPSIGNWQFPCRSHYFIENNAVRWSTPWTEEQVLAGRARDRLDVQKYFAERGATTNSRPVGTSTGEGRPRVGIFARLRRRQKH
jgi:hypothetical protein